MASYAVNRAAVRHARDLIEAKRWVLDSDWGASQPDAETENAFLEKHTTALVEEIAQQPSRDLSLRAALRGGR